MVSNGNYAALASRIVSADELGLRLSLGNEEGARNLYRGEMMNISSLSVIKRLSRDFDGHNTDAEVMAITGLARNTYYKYKAKLKSTLKIEAA